MRALVFKISEKLGLFAVGIMLLLSQSCTQKILTPTQTPIPASETPQPSTTSKVPPTGTNTFIPSTPTATVVLPQPTPAESPLPSEFQARLNLGEIDGFALSPPADRLVAAGASHTCLFTTSDYRQVWCVLTVPQVEMESPENPGYDKKVRSVSYRKDGEQIAIALWNGYIVILDAATGERVKMIQTKRAYIHTLVWSADGKQIITVSNKGGVEIWDPSSGGFVQQLDIDPESFPRAAWSADGSVFATSSHDGIITFWDATRYEPTGRLDIQSAGYVSSLAWSPDKSLIYAGISTDYPCSEDCDPKDPEYKAWVAAWSVNGGRLTFRTAAGDAITRLAVSPEGEWIAAGGGISGAFEVLDGSSGRMVVKLNDTYAQGGVGWLDDNRALFLPNPLHVDAMSITQWDMTLADHTEILLPGYETISSLGWLPDGERLVTNSAGGTLSFWQARSGERLEQFQLFAGSLPVRKFGPTWISPVEAQLAVGADGSLAIVDLEQRKVLKWLDHADIAPKVYVVDLAWSRDGQMLAGLLGDAAHAGKLTAAVWDASPGKRLLTIPEKDFEEIGRLSWSPDGKQIVLSRIIREKELKKQLVIWDLASAKEVQSLDIPCQTLKIDWFVQDQIAFNCYARTNIWDLKQGTQWETSGPIGYPEINPRGNLAVSSAAMQGMRLWEFPAGGELALLQAQSDWFSSFAFNQDGRLLAGLTDHGELVTWDVSKYY